MDGAFVGLSWVKDSWDGVELSSSVDEAIARGADYRVGYVRNGYIVFRDAEDRPVVFRSVEEVIVFLAEWASARGNNEVRVTTLEPPDVGTEEARADVWRQFAMRKQAIREVWERTRVVAAAQ